MTITVNELTAAAQMLVNAEKKTAETEKALKEAKEKERLLREETLPGMMQELGVTKMALTDGNEITVAQEVYASVPADRKELAWSWLETNNFGGLIKTEVQVAFGKGELEDARKLLDDLATIGITNGTISRDVHPQTLKAFLKEQLANPKTELTEEEQLLGMSLLNLELFGARPVLTAKVKLKK